MGASDYIPTEDRITFVREKRARFLLYIWQFMQNNDYVDSTRHNLSDPLAENLVEHYISDWIALKVRYKIPNRIRPHKVAGLMAFSILRYKPIIPNCDFFESEADVYPNEKLAIIHGLAICGEESLEHCSNVTNQNWFKDWFDEFLYLLRFRNYTSESLIFIFLTLSKLMADENH